MSIENFIDKKEKFDQLKTDIISKIEKSKKNTFITIDITSFFENMYNVKKLIEYFNKVVLTYMQIFNNEIYYNKNITDTSNVEQPNIFSHMYVINKNFSGEPQNKHEEFTINFLIENKFIEVIPKTYNDYINNAQEYLYNINNFLWAYNYLLDIVDKAKNNFDINEFKILDEIVNSLPKEKNIKINEFYKSIKDITERSPQNQMGGETLLKILQDKSQQLIKLKNKK
jgi:hypothetical protein